MDEKTAKLRDIFIDATGSDTVTESQEEGPGSLVDDGDDRRVTERVGELVSRMADRYEFESGLSDADLVQVVFGFYEGADDDDIAAELDADAETVARYRRVVEAAAEATRANHRFRDEFEELLTDADLSSRLDLDAHHDELREATEDIETNVSF
ncbi:hypothetical protein [Halopelagius longus]|uniref:Conditioned medium-induced protein 4 n=1 Tax=Halopelagius longus TaxID=1236180 RepID=A0A1H1E858_9EURY|nr:hypothetical protein [Halopelagius longus]SDQ84991.1 hypothetical protein SAMN05216278_2784 [Halopelagius longus]